MGLKKKTQRGSKSGLGFIHTQLEPHPYTHNIKKSSKP